MSACLSGRQVGLLVVRLLYRFYVVGHLSKWFTFFSFLVVCFLWSSRLLRLLPTFEHWRSGSEALFVCPAGDALRICEFEFTGFY